MPGLLNFNLDKMFFRPLIQGIHQLNALSKSISDWRVAQSQSSTQKDLFSALLEAKDPDTDRGLTQEELVSEAGLLIIAGTDTTITATTASIFYLLHFPHTLERLQLEVRRTFSHLEEIRIGTKLNSCRYLTACIDESMRFSPSIPSILPREVLPGGIVVDGEWLPEGTDVGVPHYAIHHDERYFPDSFTYKPERWIGRDRKNDARSSISTEDFEERLAGHRGTEEMGENSDEALENASLTVAQSAFTPFGIGRTSCIGKYLAYQEISLVLARMIWLYDMRSSPGSSTGEGRPDLGVGRGRKNEFQLQDRFVSMHEGPLVQFKSRL